MNREQFLLMKLAEEASEVAQIALKTVQFGMDEKHPELTQTNKERIFAELNDLLSIVEMLKLEFDFDFKFSDKQASEKMARVCKYYNYSRKLGKVEPL
jgi:hypothetical protein